MQLLICSLGLVMRYIGVREVVTVVRVHSRMCAIVTWRILWNSGWYPWPVILKLVQLMQGLVTFTWSEIADLRSESVFV